MIKQVVKMSAPIGGGAGKEGIGSFGGSPLGLESKSEQGGSIFYGTGGDLYKSEWPSCSICKEGGDA